MAWGFSITKLLNYQITKSAKLPPHPGQCLREYNRCMGGLLQPTPIPAEPERSNALPVLIAFAGIALIVLIAVLATRQKPKPQAAPPLYASNIKFSDFK